MHLPGRSCARASFMLEVPVLKESILENISQGVIRNCLLSVIVWFVRALFPEHKSSKYVPITISSKFIHPGSCKLWLIHLESPTQITLMPSSSPFLSCIVSFFEAASSNIVLKFWGKVNKPTDHLWGNYARKCHVLKQFGG